MILLYTEFLEISAFLLQISWRISGSVIKICSAALVFYDKKDSVQWWACLKKVLTFPLTASDGTSNILYTYKRTVKIKIVDQYENVYFSAIGWNWSMQITSRVNYKTIFF